MNLYQFPTKILILSLLTIYGALSSPLVSAQEQEILQEEWILEDGIWYPCGKPKPILGYEITFLGKLISIPKYVHITREENVLFSDEEPEPWNFPYTTAKYAIAEDLLLIVTQEIDCVNMDYKRLFIVQENAPIVHQPVWTGNWKDGFFLENNQLHYWSEWFCYPENKERENGQSYVYSFARESQSFERIVVDEKRYCSPNSTPPLIEFHEPDISAIAIL